MRITAKFIKRKMIAINDFSAGAESRNAIVVICRPYGDALYSVYNICIPFDVPQKELNNVVPFQFEIDKNEGYYMIFEGRKSVLQGNRFTNQKLLKEFQKTIKHVENTLVTNNFFETFKNISLSIMYEERLNYEIHAGLMLW